MDDANAAVARAFRSDYGRTVAILLRSLRDLDAAEEAVQEAFVAAAASWPRDGVPPNPQAWIVTAARRKSIGPTATGEHRAAPGPGTTLRRRRLVGHRRVPSRAWMSRSRAPNPAASGSWGTSACTWRARRTASLLSS